VDEPGLEADRRSPAGSGAELRRDEGAAEDVGAARRDVLGDDVDADRLRARRRSPSMRWLVPVLTLKTPEHSVSAAAISARTASVT